MAGTEATIERAACAKIRTKFGVENIKLHTNGWPDRQFLVPGGRPVFIEFKAPGETLSFLQAHVIKKLRTIGYRVHVCSSVDSAIRVIEEAVVRHG